MPTSNTPDSLTNDIISTMAKFQFIEGRLRGILSASYVSEDSSDEVLDSLMEDMKSQLDYLQSRVIALLVTRASSNIKS